MVCVSAMYYHRFPSPFFLISLNTSTWLNAVCGLKGLALLTMMPAFDQKSLLLYVSIHQTFHIFFLPRFIYNANVSLVAVLRLSHVPETYGGSNGKYFIASQEDLYQTNEFIKFFMPLGVGTALVWLWQAAVTLICIACALLLAPFTWAEEALAQKKAQSKS